MSAVARWQADFGEHPTSFSGPDCPRMRCTMHAMHMYAQIAMFQKHRRTDEKGRTRSQRNSSLPAIGVF